MQADRWWWPADPAGLTTTWTTKNNGRPRAIAAARSFAGALKRLDDAGVEIVSVGALDPGRNNIADADRQGALEVDRSVDLGCVGGRAALGGAPAAFIYDHMDAAADFLLQLAGADGLLSSHEPVPAVFLHIIRDEIAKFVGGGAGDGLVTETADPIELGFGEPGNQLIEFGVGLAGEADDESR